MNLYVLTWEDADEWEGTTATVLGVFTTAALAHKAGMDYTRQVENKRMIRKYEGYVVSEFQADLSPEAFEE